MTLSLEEMKAAGIAVEPLEWRTVDFGNMHIAHTLLGEYRAWEIDEGYWWHVGMQGGRRVVGDVETAKAAAQADYESRIRSALRSQSENPL